MILALFELKIFWVMPSICLIKLNWFSDHANWCDEHIIKLFHVVDCDKTRTNDLTKIIYKVGSIFVNTSSRTKHPISSFKFINVKLDSWFIWIEDLLFHMNVLRFANRLIEQVFRLYKWEQYHNSNNYRSNCNWHYRIKLYNLYKRCNNHCKLNEATNNFEKTES